MLEDKLNEGHIWKDSTYFFLEKSETFLEIAMSH